VGGASRQRQGKIAHPAEQIQHPVLRLQIQPRQRGTHHLLIHAVVDLDKIPRTEH